MIGVPVRRTNLWAISLPLIKAIFSHRVQTITPSAQWGRKDFKLGLHATAHKKRSALLMHVPGESPAHGTIYWKPDSLVEARKSVGQPQRQ